MESQNHSRVESAVNGPELMDRIGDDRLLLRELLELFRSDATVQVDTAHRALESGNLDKVERAGHALKGMLANLAAPQAGSLAGQLEEMGRSGDLKGAAELLTRLREELLRVESALAVLCDGGSL